MRLGNKHISRLNLFNLEYLFIEFATPNPILKYTLRMQTFVREERNCERFRNTFTEHQIIFLSLSLSNSLSLSHFLSLSHSPSPLSLASQHSFTPGEKWDAPVNCQYSQIPSHIYAPQHLQIYLKRNVIIRFNFIHHVEIINIFCSKFSNVYLYNPRLSKTLGLVKHQVK